MLPNSWDCILFGETYAQPSRNGIYKSSEYQGRGTRIVNMGEMFGFEFISNQEMSRVELNARELSVNGLQDGDLLFGRRSVVPAGAGKCSLVVLPEEALTFESSIIRVRLKNWIVQPKFYYYFFASTVGRSIIGSIVAGTNVKGIRATELRELKVPMPALVEQRAIASALSDVDTLLAKIDQLIAKKRDLKQAAMQQLLTGQTRLPGFSGEWEVNRLGDLLLEISDGGTPSTANRSNFGGPISWVVIDDIRDEIWATKETLSERGLRACAAKLWPIGTLILSTGATIGEVGIAKVPVATKQGICGLMFNLNLAIPGFMKYWLQQNKQLLLSKAQGSSIKEVRAPTLVQFSLCMPNVAEQTAIATVLSDMDAELSALEARRDKTRALKQGMMQALLTGRIRLTRGN